MQVKFKYTRDKRCRWFSAATSFAIVVVFGLIFFFGGGDYLYAWIFSLLAAIVLLCTLSIPRNVTVTDDYFEIRCLVEMTRINIRDISSIRKTDKDEYKRLLVTIGSYGFFGYYGYYFDFRQWESVKVYTTEWNHLVEIEDIYEQRYLISCRQADKLIETVMQAKLEHAGEDDSRENEEGYS